MPKPPKPIKTTVDSPPVPFRGRSPVKSWDFALDGRVHKITPDMMASTAENCRSHLHNRANEIGKLLQTRIEGGALYVQAIERPDWLEPGDDHE